MNSQLLKWHRFVETQNSDLLSEILADDVKFHSPFVWKPKEGKLITTTILLTAATVFQEFKYIREVLQDKNWALEFEAKIGDLSMRGIDLITLNDEGEIIDFEVMIRPANALQALGIEMTKKLVELGAV